MRRQGNRRSKLFAKILTVTVSAVILSVTLCGGAVYLYLEPILTEQFAEDSRSMVIKLADQVSYNLEDVEAYARDICLDDTVQNGLRDIPQRQSYSYYAHIGEMQQKLNQYTLMRDKTICSILLLDREDRILDANLYARSVFDTLQDDPIFLELLENRWESAYLSPTTVGLNSHGVSRDVIPYVRSIFDKDNPSHYLGRMIVLADYDAMITPLLVDGNSGIAVALYNDRSDLVFRSGTDADLETMSTNTPGERHMYREGLFFQKTLSSPGWRIAGFVAGTQVRRGFRNITYVMVAIMVISSLIMLAVVYFVVNRVTRPMETLIRGMKSVSDGQQEVSVEVHSGDEIEELAAVFNTMVTAVSRNTAELLAREKKEHYLALRMLLYQINPHFIYNTLNCTIILARRGDCAAIITLTRLFISLLRNILKTDPMTYTTLEAEMTHIDNYVSILKYSYNDTFHLEWDLESPALSALRLPKLLLYPLVENSIFHGALPKAESCTIRVRVRHRGNCVAFTVLDDGAGMDAATLSTLRAKLREPAEYGEHIGLVNTNNRLLFLYGASSALRVHSRPGRCTRVVFRLPQTDAPSEKGENVT